MGREREREGEREGETRRLDGEFGYEVTPNIAYIYVLAPTVALAWWGNFITKWRIEGASDPDLVPPDLVTPRFSDRINFPRYRKLTVFDPDLVPTPI
eukprot:sb/3478997/